MADKSKFEYHIRQVENANDPAAKMDALAAMLFTIATNDLACIEKKIKVISVALAAIGIAVLLGESVSLPSIIGFLAKIFGA